MWNDSGQTTRTRATIPRAHMGSPSRGAVNRSCVVIKQYIEVVKKVEKIHKHIKPVDLVTALRKVWNGSLYDSWFWDRLLYNAREKQLDLDKGGVDPDDPKKTLTLTYEDRRILAGIQCLRTGQHGCIDFGHTLTGIDACCHPRPKPALLHELDTPDNKKLLAAVTWAGDVGSVYEAYRDNPRLGFQAHWNDKAHDDDLLGDVDGVVLGTQIKGGLALFNTGGFAAQLERYYGTGMVLVGPGLPPTVTTMNQQQIFQEFVKIYPLGKSEPYVDAFIDAKTLGKPKRYKGTRQHKFFTFTCKRWEQWVKSHVSSLMWHACTNDYDKDAKQYRMTSNRRGSSLGDVSKRKWEGDQPP